MKQTRKVLMLLVSIVAAFAISSCGGGSGGSSIRQLPGIYLVDQGHNRIVWLADMTPSNFGYFSANLSNVGTVTNGSVDVSGHIYLINQGASAIVRYNDLSGHGRIVYGSHGSGVGQFLNPVRVAADSLNNIYVVDRDQNLLIQFPASGATWTTLDLSPWFIASNEPDLTIDATGHIFLAGGSTIVKLTGMTATGAVTFGTSGAGVGQFGLLNGICLDDQGKIYVADGTNNRIARIDDMNGTNWVAFGSAGSGTNEFDIPFGIGVDHSGLIYISDRNNNRLVRVNDMAGSGWVEVDSLSNGTFSFPLSVFPHLPAF